MCTPACTIDESDPFSGRHAAYCAASFFSCFFLPARWFLRGIRNEPSQGFRSLTLEYTGGLVKPPGCKDGCGSFHKKAQVVEFDVLIE